MLRIILTVFTMMGMSLLKVNADSSTVFNPHRAHAKKINTHIQEIKEQEKNSVTQIEFGQTQDGQKVTLFSLTNPNGLVAKITNYGAILTELHLPDNKGKLDDVVLGFDNLEDYLSNNNFYFGAVVGRVANRIKDARFTLDDQEYNLAANASPHHIHGGDQGFDKGETYRHVMVHKFDTKQNNLGEILDANTEVEEVAGGFEFTEGPLWHPDGFLLFSDIPANTIYKWQPGKKTEVFRQPSGNANGNTFDQSGRLITGEHGNRRVSRTEKDGTVVTLASNYEGKRLNSPNDLAVKSDGSIYFTDPPYGIKSEQEELGFYGVYRLAPDGTLTLLVDDFVRPNGIVFSPDESKLYVNDSEEGHIRVFDVQPDGTLDTGKLFAELKPSSKEGAADGMKVDIKGNIYSTGPGGVWVFAPNGGLLGIIETPEAPANLAWGDRDYQTLYITARNSLYRVRLQIPGVR